MTDPITALRDNDINNLRIVKTGLKSQFPHDPDSDQVHGVAIVELGQSLRDLHRFRIENEKLRERVEALEKEDQETQEAGEATRPVIPQPKSSAGKTIL